jgi:signal transduction histidine kinase
MGALMGWMLAAPAVLLAGVAWARQRRRLELVARACHELRGPLAAAQLALHASRRHAEAPAGRLAAIEVELNRAGLALDDLAAARSGRRAADRDDVVDLGDLVAQQAETWEAVAPVFGCTLDVGPTPAGVALVRGDRVRLAQALGNILANSFEHGSGTVRVRVRTTGEHVRIEVSDEGPGLQAPIAELVARPRAGRGGRGRGLAITAEIVDRHGGRVMAAPSRSGARVALELPSWHGEMLAAGGQGGVR